MLLSDQLKKSITCPVTQLIFLSPVSLVPSGITIEEEAAEKIFAEARKDNQIPKCPLSQKQLTGYQKNYVMLSTVDSLLKEYTIEAGDRYTNESEVRDNTALLKEDGTSNVNNASNATNIRSTSTRVPLMSSPASPFGSEIRYYQNGTVIRDESAREYYITPPCGAILKSAHLTASNTLKIACIGMKKEYWYFWTNQRADALFSSNAGADQVKLEISENNQQPFIFYDIRQAHSITSIPDANIILIFDQNVTVDASLRTWKIKYGEFYRIKDANPTFERDGAFQSQSYKMSGYDARAGIASVGEKIAIQLAYLLSKYADEVGRNNSPGDQFIKSIQDIEQLTVKKPSSSAACRIM